MEIEVEGDRELARALRKTGRLRASDLADSWQQIAQSIETDASAFVTVDTGRLANTIRIGKAKGRAVVRAGGYGVKYAGVQNYGWPAHNIEPEHWLNRALLGNEDYSNETIRTGIMRIADRNGVF